MKSGRRLMKGSRKIRSSTIENYENLRDLLSAFSEAKKFELRIKILKNNKISREYKAEKKYWKEFYIRFTEFLYKDRDCYDNYVGSNIKLLKVFFNYLYSDLEMNIGQFYKKFDVVMEEIEILVLHQNQLQFLIHNKEFARQLTIRLEETRDIFVFGCTVALRISDLLKLSKSNLEIIDGKHYLRVTSGKTDAFTRMLLPKYAVDIINRYKHLENTLLPVTSKAQFNFDVKELISLANFNDERIVKRHKRGVPVYLYKDPIRKIPFRLSDLVSSHTMRRTAITTLLCLKVPETVVRKISGHAPNSKEFYKYVELSQKYMDEEVERAHSLLGKE